MRQRYETATEVAERRLLRHQSPLESWVEITVESHPALHDAFETISHDCGYGAGHETYSVPPEWVSYLDLAEWSLGPLDREQRQIVVIGEQREKSELIAYLPGGSALDQLLEAFWRDWEED